MKSRRRLWSLLAALGLVASAHASGPVLVIHAGAGAPRKDMPPAREKAIRAALTQALLAGYTELKVGKPAIDGVTAALVVLEDDPLFNAGRGSVFTHAGTLEMDAAIMDGYTLRAGSVAAIDHVRNPILAARAVMEHSSHVMLVGAGAEAFARSQGLAMESDAWFRTEERWQQLQRALKEDAANQPHADEATARHFGTVGAVALDVDGHLAAGTSTGGMNDKLPGRVGDSPIIGAGTYANSGCAVSGTGWGEFYMRTVAAHAICMRVTQLRMPIARAAAEVINQEIPAMGGNGGAIALDDRGHIAIPFNTDGMFRGWIDGSGKPHVAIFGDEDDGTGETLPAPAPDDAASSR
ncbi:isoaspartyl peptidase/L-asparaginase family protein [Dyella lutea]|uniref:Isoaspartyl peptidase/L-asparaginase n=1 Tax=Dyella lutea TaxID=2950441 RepID=A0ABT1F9J5_9GAMM|nr:isoaspartyl peptidase/L-asparaginase [Dyella lutea]